MANEAWIRTIEKNWDKKVLTNLLLWTGREHEFSSLIRKCTSNMSCSALGGMTPLGKTAVSDFVTSSDSSDSECDADRYWSAICRYSDRSASHRMTLNVWHDSGLKRVEKDNEGKRQEHTMVEDTKHLTGYIHEWVLEDLLLTFCWIVSFSTV